MQHQELEREMDSQVIPLNDVIQIQEDKYFILSLSYVEIHPLLMCFMGLYERP